MAPLTFSSSKSWIVTLAIWGTTGLLAFMLAEEVQSTMSIPGKIGVSLFCIATSGLLLWMWFGTYYRISGEILHFRCGPLHGSIPIQKIREVKQNQHLWSGLRPALGLHGLVINYNRWDTIYFSPAEKDKFLQALHQVNPNIEVKA